MTQQIKVLAAKPKDPSSIPGTHVVGGKKKTDSLKLSFGPQHTA